ncbi:cleavage stimulating factor 64 [Andrographis paniculata]|uniref:cleavage stimulating factor 64 n=1 Tax=Andrographis paniculata TaxID=175694 RepID=UPI0021E7D354|nr:cleavage stimulating factor 64 [Andrographis paniculata]
MYTVGNIPYDATEEQLIQICEEVGPVVSFRLVVDRETGKPKGYGFCEYKDEETALSARRNLQGYEINGRQLRVDFAENDKNSDRNREQGRGGPGVAPNLESQKQFGGPAGLGHSNLHQPIGDSVAMAASTVMAGALGSAQISSASNQIGMNSHSLPGSDPLTRYLAKMSRNQLTEVLSELKAMATQNKEQARQLLLSRPNLSKALFQAQVMLGLVSPQMLQMPNIQQAVGQLVQPSVQNSQSLPGLPPLPQNKTQLSYLPSVHENQVSTAVQKQYPALHLFPTHSQIQNPQLPNQILNQGHNDLPILQDGDSHPSVLKAAHFSATGFQPSSSISSPMPENMDLKGNTLTFPGKTRMTGDGIDQMDRMSKMAKLNDEKASPFSHVATVATPATPFLSLGVSERQAPNAAEAQKSEKKAIQMQVPSNLDSTLLQQVLNLTPEQLNSLPPDQQQQVIQLQQMLRQAI